MTNSQGTHLVLLLTKKKLYILICSELNIFLKISNIKDKFITRNTFKIQSDDSIMCEFYCITFIEFMIVWKTLLDYTNLFSLNGYQKNDNIL